jgi:hypothetical protein
MNHPIRCLCCKRPLRYAKGQRQLGPECYAKVMRYIEGIAKRERERGFKKEEER